MTSTTTEFESLRERSKQADLTLRDAEALERATLAAPPNARVAQAREAANVARRALNAAEAYQQTVLQRDQTARALLATERELANISAQINRQHEVMLAAQRELERLKPLSYNLQAQLGHLRKAS